MVAQIVTQDSAEAAPMLSGEFTNAEPLVAETFLFVTGQFQAL